MKTKFILSAVAALVLFLNTNAKPISVEDGKNIFSSQCASCHNVNAKLVGPALANVENRRNIDWIIKFVQSSQTMVKSNDKAAVALFAEFNQTVMPDHLDITAEQVGSVVEYIKSQAKAPLGADAAPFARPGKTVPNYVPVAITNFNYFGTYLAIVLFTISCLVLAVKVKELQRENTNKKKGIGFY